MPPRPMRCRPLATDGGASICTTRSIAPMSMPSSSDEVATSARRLPGLEQILDLDALRPRESIRDASAPAFRRQLVERAGQALGSRRLLTKISVERCARISSSSRGWMADQIEGRESPTDAGPLGNSSLS
jgi:hypothetical protein